MSFLITSIRPCARSLARPAYVTSAIRQVHRSRKYYEQLAEQQYPNPLPPAPDGGPAPDYAFVFDIDGVLLHGNTPLPRAKETLEYLNDNHIPFMLLTNGGGVREAARVVDLTSRLRLRHPISEEQFVQSHTPFKLLRKTAPQLKTVLALGGKEENVREAAHEYGFKNVVIPADFLKSYPGISPFSNKAHYNKVGNVMRTPPKIDAVLVFNDPRDWALDIQVIIDLLLSEHGQVGTRRPVDQVLKEGHIPIYFSNPDLWWANEYPHSRLGQGGFRAALEGVWRAVTGGKELEATTIGKPHQPTYEYAEEVLTKWRKRKLKKSHADAEHPELRTVYMVGDNPASDIAGANLYKSPRGTEWVSVLVRTGVFKEGDSDGNAKAVVDNVEEAVRWAVERQRQLENIE